MSKARNLKMPLFLSQSIPRRTEGCTLPGLYYACRASVKLMGTMALLCRKKRPGWTAGSSYCKRHALQTSRWLVTQNPGNVSKPENKQVCGWFSDLNIPSTTQGHLWTKIFAIKKHVDIYVQFKTRQPAKSKFGLSFQRPAYIIKNYKLQAFLFHIYLLKHVSPGERALPTQWLTNL